MNIEDAFTRDDAMIETFIEQATAMIRQHTRREWTQNVYTDYLSTADIDVAINRGGVYKATLREKPISVAPAEYPALRYSASGNWDDTDDIPISNYTIDVRKNQIIMYPGVMTYRPRSLRCVYTAGYPVVDVTVYPDPLPNPPPLPYEVVQVPTNIRQACIAQAAYMVRRELNSTAGSSREEGGNRMRGYWMTQTGLVREALALIRTEVRLLVGGNT